MAQSNVNVTTAEKHIDEVWEEGVISALEFDVVIVDKSDTSWEFKGHGDKFHKPRFPNIETEAKQASTALNPVAYTDTEQEFTINQDIACAIKVENIADLLSRTDIKAKMMQKMGYALARDLDSFMADLVDNFSQFVGTLGMDITYEDMLDACQYLEVAGYDVMNDCAFIVSPQAKNSLLKLDSFTHASYVGEEAAKKAHTKGMLGHFGGVPIFVSNLTNSPASGQHDSMLFHRETMVMILAQDQKTHTQTDALHKAEIIVKSNIYGGGEMTRYSEAAGNITATDEGGVWIKGK